MQQDFGNANNDIMGVQIAASRLAAFTPPSGVKNRKLLIVLSDGLPSVALSSESGSNTVATRTFVQQVEQNMNVFGIGLNSYSVQAIYTNNCVLDHLDDTLLNVLASRIQDFIMHGK
jgi:hypothetical protein